MASTADNAASAAAVEPLRPRPTCIGCLQSVAFPYAKMGCGCYYCTDCLPLLVGASLNGASFPSSCCGLPIDMKRLIVQALAGPDLIQRHERRVQEEAQAAEARRAARDNVDAVAVRALAREQGWAECGRCGRIIERIHGCNHMTCPCSHQFCYACGKEWSACPCRRQPFGGGFNVLNIVGAAGGFGAVGGVGAVGGPVVIDAAGGTVDVEVVVENNIIDLTGDNGNDNNDEHDEPMRRVLTEARMRWRRSLRRNVPPQVPPLARPRGSNRNVNQIEQVQNRQQ